MARRGEPFAIRSRQEIGRVAWDAAVEASPSAWLWHRFEFLDAIATWPGRVDRSFAVCDGGSGDVLSVIPLQSIELRGARWHRQRTFECQGGPAYLQPRATLDAFVAESVERVARRVRGLDVYCSASPLAPACRPGADAAANPCAALGWTREAAYTWMVDLSRSESEIRGAYSTLTKRELRQSERAGVEVIDATPADLGTYYELHLETYRRTGARPHPRAYFEAIFKTFLPLGLCRILLAVVKGEVVAAQNTALYKGGAFYWTGASRTARRGGENRLLFDTQILAARARGCAWYDVGEAFPDAQAGKLKGLNDFKRSFGSELHPVYHGRLVLSPRTFAAINWLRARRGLVT